MAYWEANGIITNIDAAKPTIDKSRRDEQRKRMRKSRESQLSDDDFAVDQQ